MRQCVCLANLTFVCLPQPAPAMSRADASDESHEDESIEVLALSSPREVLANAPTTRAALDPDVSEQAGDDDDTATTDATREKRSSSKLATVRKGSRAPLRLDEKDLARLEEETLREAALAAKVATRAPAPALPLPPLPVSSSAAAVAPLSPRHAGPPSASASSGSIAQVSPRRVESRSNSAASINRPSGTRARLQSCASLLTASLSQRR